MKKEKKGGKVSKKDSPKKEICQIFKLEKKGKEKIVESCGPEEIEKSQNKQLKYVLIGICSLIIFLWVGYFIIDSARHFEYVGITGKSISGEVVREQNLIFHKVAIPVSYQGEIAAYNFYLRNSPEDLVNVSVDGRLVYLDNAVLNISGEFDCNGDGVIAIANLANLMKTIGIKMIKDDNAGCDEQGRYLFLRIQEGETNSIERVDDTCYDLNVNNCEILKVLEKYMYETLVKVSDYYASEKLTPIPKDEVSLNFSR